MTVLVTGSTGYIGGRLVPLLVRQGHRVRVLVRDHTRIESRPWRGQVEVVVGDAIETDTLERAMKGVDTAYYLIHSMSSASRFGELDQRLARTFGRIAGEIGVPHVIYLGGLANPHSDLSPHLRSRQQTGAALRAGGATVTEFRAAVIIGAGSISFEMIRNLVERLPVMICPQWIYSRVQPIAIDDVLSYLIAALDNDKCRGGTIEIGGGSVTTYRGLMLTYARARGLRRLLLPVPVLTPRLSSYWVHWVTPVHAGMARALVEGLRNDAVVADDRAHRVFPAIRPTDHTGAVAREIRVLDRGGIDTSWRDAAGTPRRPFPAPRLESRQGLIMESRHCHVIAPPGDVYRVVSGIGGKRGWYCANWAWQARGLLDRLLGGVGLRRGRRHPDDLRVGDALDFWRVEAIEPDQMIRLRAEMKLPGSAWLQFVVRRETDGTTHLLQSAGFAPKGVPGLIYWYLLYPVHAWIFGALIREIKRRSESLPNTE